MFSLSYHDELKQARQWRRYQSADEVKQAQLAACETLQKLRRQFPYVLAIGHELVHVLEKLGELKAAIVELKILKATFPNLDAETLCRSGKIHKALALEAVRNGSIGEGMDKLMMSAKDYRRAFDTTPSPYSRVNELFARYYRAALLAEQGSGGTQPTVPPSEWKAELERVKKEAAALLDDASGIWEHKLDDDSIWMPASKAEAAFLCQRWERAAEDYTHAMREAGGKHNYYEIMHGQLKYLCEAAGKLGMTLLPTLDHPDKFFR
jgi:tetratricopeptide (TPR) repeat protein